MNNKIVLFANLKGGVGKSTLCATFANYLRVVGLPVIVFDADIQRSVLRHRQREIEAAKTRAAEAGEVFQDPQIPWQVLFLDSRKTSDMLPKMKELQGAVLVDMPGNIDDPNLLSIYKAADILVVPMTYDSDNIDSTQLFCQIMKEKAPSAKMMIIPNNIVSVQEKSASVIEDRKNAYAALQAFGFITPKIKQSLVVKNYSTLNPLDRYATNAVKYAFDPIVEALKK